MGKRRSVSAPLVITGLIVFLIADLALVIFALQPPSQSSSTTQSTPSFTALSSTSATPTPTPSSAPTTATPTPAPTGASTPSPTASGSAGASASPTPAELQGFADAQVGYRTTAGSCTGPDAVVELTTDGGTTWKNVNPTNLRIREVDSIIVVDSDHVDLLAKYGDDCTLSAVSTYTQGEYWQAYPERTAELQAHG